MEDIRNWLRLAKKIEARFGEDRVIIRDIGLDGALLSSPAAYAPGNEAELEFESMGQHVRAHCVVAGVGEYEDDSASHFELLIRITSSSAELVRFAAAYREEIRRAELANAQGRFEDNIISQDRLLSDLGSAAREKHRHYIRCRLVAPGRWTREATSSPQQPYDGFVIAAHEAEEQIRLLELAYEEAEENGRAMLREFAAVSLAE